MALYAVYLLKGIEQFWNMVMEQFWNMKQNGDKLKFFSAQGCGGNKDENALSVALSHPESRPGPGVRTSVLSHLRLPLASHK